MNGLAQALSELTAALGRADMRALGESCRRVRAAVPPGDPDLVDLADSMLSILADAADIDPQILIAQLEGMAAGMTMLVEADQATATAGGGTPGASSPRHAESAPLPAWVDGAMLSEFVDAQQHGLAEVEQMLLDPENFGDAEAQRLARILHTLKGESSTVGFSILEELYHALEDAIGSSRALDVVDDTLAVKDWVLTALPALIAGHPLPDGRTALLDRLRGKPEPKQAAPSTGPEPTTHLPKDPEVLALFGEFHDEAIESLTTADELLMAIEGSGPDAASVDALFRVFHTIKGLAGFLDLGALGALAHAAEALLHDARDNLKTLTPGRLDQLLRATTMIRKLLTATRLATEQGRDEVVVEGFDLLLQDVLAARSNHATAAGASRSQRPPAPTPVEKPRPAAKDGDGEEGEQPSGPKMQATIRETLKVELSRVDGLVETIGELVIIEAMVNSSTGSVSTATQRHLSQLSKVVRDLQRQGLALRMVPLRGVFQKMNRLVRDLSQRSGKEIRLELAGQDAEMDRSLAERLGDPLVHMLRNAVDHGIEPKDVRIASGKPRVATVRLSAYHEGGNIIIELADDGRGLDKQAIVDKAIARGLISASTQLSDREIWELIFHPGFSTAKAVTELSGRGVGMDVVKKTVDELRGRIQISSVQGEGTTFRIVLPLTLAIIDGMLLGVGGRRYVLPTLSIIETLQPAPGQIHRFASAAILDVRGQRLPLVDLGGLLGVSSDASRDPTTGFIVVIDGINSKFGLLTDQLIGQQQVVIKQIDAAVNQLGLFSGAAILSDGQVGLILNPAALRAEMPTRRVAAPTLEA